MPDEFPGDSVVAIRSLTNVVWCAGKTRLHEIIDNTHNLAAYAGELDKTTSCGPHLTEPMRYPHVNAAIAVDTPEGTWMAGSLAETPEDVTAHYAGGQQIPWLLVLPTGERLIVGSHPSLVASMLSEFAGIRMFAGSVASVDDAFNTVERIRAQLDILDGHTTLDPTDQQL